MKPNLTKDQRKRLLLLARLLDRVPSKRFDISGWIFAPEGSKEGYIERAQKLGTRTCGYAGCAIGWGMTSAKIRGKCTQPSELADELMSGTANDWIDLFGPDRTRATPKRIASDIRTYLKTGALPKE